MEITISIHALLAESDFHFSIFDFLDLSFLSTLSLRRATVVKMSIKFFNADFYPRSPCGERRFRRRPVSCDRNFYPRSPCGERPYTNKQLEVHTIFLSTLSLRRATRLFVWIAKRALISIHALLAESDIGQMAIQAIHNISIHALLAESDSRSPKLTPQSQTFLSTLSLRRAT